MFKTTLLENIIGYSVDIDPCPILLVRPDEDAAEEFSKNRLAPMIRDTECLRKIFGDGKATDAGDTLAHKQFPGGHISMVSARSPTDLAMRPIKRALYDETDLYPLSAGGKGPPIDLGDERLAEFEPATVSVRVCSPTVEGASNIDNSYKESDQRKAFVECPHCQHAQTLTWDRVRWSKDKRDRIDLETVHYLCVGCEKPWREADRLKALQKVEWRQTREFDCCGKHQKPERWKTVYGVSRAVCSDCGRLAVPNEHAGFQVSKLYAPKQALRDLVKKFRRARESGSDEALKTFYNTQLAQTWKEASEAPDWNAVHQRRGKHLLDHCPAGVLTLFAGVDVQKDRIEARIWGFGRSRQRWLISIIVLPGYPTQPDVWKALEALFSETWPHELGGELGVRDWGIDSGSYSSEVAAFVRSQRGRGNVHAVRGYDRYDGAFLGVGAMDVSADGKKRSRGLKVLKMGVSFCKQEIVGQLGLDRPVGDAVFPPGFIHLPENITEDEVKQLTSEHCVTRAKRGRTKREWDLIEGRRNEGLDCANYARGLAAMRGWDRWREATFIELEARVHVSAGTEDPVPVGTGETSPVAHKETRGKWFGGRQRGWLGPK